MFPATSLQGSVDDAPRRAGIRATRSEGVPPSDETKLAEQPDHPDWAEGAESGMTLRTITDHPMDDPKLTTDEIYAENERRAERCYDCSKSD